MKQLSLIFILLALSSASIAADTWVKGQATTNYEFTNGKTGSGVTLLPVLGHEALPLVTFAPDFLSSDVFATDLMNIVPADHELVQLLTLKNTDFEQAVESTIKHHIKNGIFGKDKGTSVQKKAWKVVNTNLKKPFHLQLQIQTYYQVIDFDLIGGQGEGGEWRSTCFAGFRNRVEFTVKSFEFPGEPALTKSAKGVIGSVFKVRNDFYVGRSFLSMQIDLNPESGAAFLAECKNQKQLL